MAILSSPSSLASDYDVVIVGAGPIGLALCRSLAGKHRRVLVLEAGNANETKAGRDAFRGTLGDGCPHPALDLYRVRALGGAGRIWGGRCIPFDDLDFQRREWVAGSGWPIDRDQVSAYQAEALLLAEAGEDRFDPSDVLGAGRGPLLEGLEDPDVATTLERFSRPTDLWRRLRAELAASPNVDVAPDHAVTAVRVSEDGRVRFLEVFARGRKLTVSAPLYVVAAGGLETARLLLCSDDVRSGGLGGRCLGRHYMSHLCSTGATLRLDSGDATRLDYERDGDGIYVRRRLWISPEAQRRHGLLNTTFRTHLPDPGDPSHGSAVLSAMFLAKSFVQREYAATFSEGEVGLSARVLHLRNVLTQPAALGKFSAKWLRRRVLASRKLPSVVLAEARGGVLEFHAEQEPNFDSRVSLGTGVDALGMRRLHVDWRTTALDVDSVVRSHKVLDGALRRSGVGGLNYDEDTLAERAGRLGFVGGHHIGLCRMAASERTGVVDADLKVFGTANLHVCSAAVLPTSGQANPTLTALCLALRLAKHLDARLTKGDIPLAVAA